MMHAEGDQMAQRYREGASLSEIGREFSLSPMTVRRRIMKRGVTMRAPGRQPVEDSPTRLAMARRKKRIHLPERDVIREYEKGSSLKEVAESFGSSVSTIRNVLVRNGIQRRDPAGRPPVLTGERRSRAVALYEQGLSAADVASHLNVSREVVQQAVREAGAMRAPNATRTAAILSTHEMQEIARRYKSGETILSLAREYDLPRSTLQRRLSAMGLRKPS